MFGLEIEYFLLKQNNSTIFTNCEQNYCGHSKPKGNCRILDTILTLHIAPFVRLPMASLFLQAPHQKKTSNLGKGYQVCFLVVAVGIFHPGG